MLWAYDGRQATSFLVEKYNGFTKGNGNLRIVKMECSPFIFQSYKDELESLVSEDGYHNMPDYETLNFKSAKLTADASLQDHEVTITFMSETKVKI